MNKVIVNPFDVTLPNLSINNKLFNFLPFDIKKVSSNKINDSHWHDHLQIWYTISGNYLHTVNGITYPQSPGSAMIIFPYMIHSIDTSKTNLKDAEIIQISVKKNVLEDKNIPFLGHTYENASFDSFYLKQHAVITGKDKQIADLICMDIWAEYQKRMAMHTNKILNDIGRFLELCVKNSDKVVNKRELAAVKAKTQCIDEAMKYLLSNVAGKMTIDDISNAAMMSRRTFTATFNQTIGQTCHNYITSLRLARAYQLLRITDKSISEIAAECGFFDSSHFAQKCQEFFGIPPLAIRRQHGKWMREYGDEIFRERVKEEAWTLLYTEQMLEEHQISLLHY